MAILGGHFKVTFHATETSVQRQQFFMIFFIYIKKGMVFVLSHFGLKTGIDF